jgi:predicted transcriptional regulator
VRALVKHQRKLTVGVTSAKQAGDDFVRAWKRSEKGLPPVEPINRLHFTDTATLFKYLSPKRFELLQHLREAGPLSIRKLAAQMRRDYKNVHTDVKDLLYVGLIEETLEGLLSVPWDSIVSELPLLAKAK